jgi:hypothetical protein
MRFLRLLVVISVVAPPLACIEYKAEPEDGKQACASTGTKLCPDNYQCINQRCYKKGSGPSGTGGTGGGGSSGSKAGSMTCNDAGMSCEKTGGALSICCNETQCKFVAGSSEFPCAGVDCQAAAQDAVNYCSGWSTGGSGGSKGGASGQAGAKSSSSSRVGGSTTGSGGGAGSKASTISSTASSGDTVTFRNGAAVGPMTGYGWIALAAGDTLTDPTCDTARLPITSTQPCSGVVNWNAANALCISGTIPALPAIPTTEDYTSNWGIQIGVNAKESMTGTLGRSYSTMAMVVSNSPTKGFRIVLHRQGDPDSLNYCYDGAASGTVVQLRQFNTMCWGDAATVYLQTSDIPTIDRLGIQFNSASKAITLSNTCLTGINFGN